MLRLRDVRLEQGARNELLSRQAILSVPLKTTQVQNTRRGKRRIEIVALLKEAGAPEYRFCENDRDTNNKQHPGCALRVFRASALFNQNDIVTTEVWGGREQDQPNLLKI